MITCFDVLDGNVSGILTKWNGSSVLASEVTFSEVKLVPVFWRQITRIYNLFEVSSPPTSAMPTSISFAKAIRLQIYVQNVRHSPREVLQYNRDADGLLPWAW